MSAVESPAPRELAANPEPDTIALGANVEVRPSKHGRGVFALCDFAVGDVIEDCPLIHMGADDVVGGPLNNHIFTDHTSDGMIALLGFGMIYNHSPTPNAEHAYWPEEPELDIVSIVATRAIKEGDEIRISYGEQWWEDRGETPDADEEST